MLDQTEGRGSGFPLPSPLCPERKVREMPTVSGSILVAGCGKNIMSVIHEWSKDRDAFKKTKYA